MQDNAKTESFSFDLLPTHTHKRKENKLPIGASLSDTFIFYLCAPVVSCLHLCVGKKSKGNDF